MNRRVSRREFLRGMTLAAGAMGLGPAWPGRAAGQAMRKIKYTLPWAPHGGYAFSFVARHENYWSKRGLDVQVDRGFGSGDACKNVAVGRYEFGLADFGTMITAVARDLDLVCLAMVSHKGQMGLLSLKKTGITKPKDLEGKRYGTVAGSADFAIWPAFVKAAGIDAGKVKVVFMGPEIRIKALIEGQVDAIGTFYGSDAPTFLANRIDYNLLLYANYGLEMYSHGIITRSQLVREDPKLCQDFVDGVMEGLAFSYLHPERTVEIHLDMVREYKGGETNREVARHGVLIGTAMGLAGYVEDHGLGWMDRRLVEGTHDKMVRYMSLPKVPPVDGLYTNRFADRVKLSRTQWKQVRESVKAYML